MAIGAQKLEVPYAIVGAIAVYVVKRERKRRTKPLRHAATLAPVVFQAQQEQPSLQIAAIRVSAPGEDFV
jgi:hypothetical protein